MRMKIMIDGDACNVITLTEKIARAVNIPCHIYCDSSRIIESQYSEIHIVGTAHDATDFAIINKCDNNDIVITNDSGLAAMVLAKNGYAIKSNGVEFNKSNINQFLNRRYVNSRARRKRNNVKGWLYSGCSSVPHKSYTDTLSHRLNSLLITSMKGVSD